MKNLLKRVLTGNVYPKSKKNFLLIIISVITVSTVNAKVIYVDSSHIGGTQSGTSWATAYNSLASAISSSTSGDSIWVAKGTYKPSSGNYFAMTDGVKVFGGFLNTNTLFSQRNYATNITILKDNGGNYVAYYTTTAPASTVLDGFTITGSAGQQAVWSQGSTTFSNLIITNNGNGGMRITAGSPTITNTSFSYNTFGSGGGLKVTGGSSTLNNVTFSNNTGTNGGGINISSGSMVLTNATFSNNTGNVGAGIYNNGALTLTNGSFTNNTCIGTGGGGGLFSSAGSNNVSISNVIFDGNSITNTFGGGGALYAEGSSGNFTGTHLVFANNTVGGQGSGGGAAYMNGTSSSSIFTIIITDAVFYNNSTTGNTNSKGGAIFIDNYSDAIMVNTTFANNKSAGSSGSGGAIFDNSRTTSSSYYTNITNSVFYGNTITGANTSNDITFSGSNYATITYNYLQASLQSNSNLTSNHNTISTSNPFSNISSPKGTDATWMTADDGLELVSSSSAFDAGNNSAAHIPSDDITEGDRIVNVVDMGAYEIGNTWKGLNTTWNDVTNWSSGSIPLSSNSAIIPTGVSNYPVMNSGSGAVKNITIQSGASLTVNGTGQLSVAGSISNSGTLDVSAGTLKMNGSSFQTLDGSWFAGKTIANLIDSTTSLTIVGTSLDTLKIANVLSFGNINNATLATGNNIDLLSDCSSITARVADITNDGANSGNIISGKVIVERCVPGHRAWRLLTAPVTNSNTIYNSWQNNGEYTEGEGTLITMPSPPVNSGLDAGINSSYSMMSFNNSTQQLVKITDTKSTNISPGNNGNADNTGYYIFVRGDRNPATIGNSNYTTLPTDNTVLSSFGNLQTGDQVFTTSSTAGGYTLIGNPYASPIDFSKLTFHNVLNRFYVWDPTLSQVGAYVVLDDVDGDGIYDQSTVSNQTTDIQSGQAFYVQTFNAGSASLTVSENAKSSTSNILVFRPSTMLPSINVNLILNGDTTNTYLDGSLAQFGANYSAAVDWQDAPKLDNTNENIGFVRGGKKLSIERRPLITSADTLFIQLSKTTINNYQMNLVTNNFQQGVTGNLVDNYLHKITPLDLTNETKINFSITTDTASASSNRFMIVFRPAGIVPVSFTAVKAGKLNTATAISWAVENQSAISHYEVEKSTDGNTFTTIATVKATAMASSQYQWLDSVLLTGNSYYRIKSVGDNGITSYSNVVVINNTDYKERSIHLLSNNYSGSKEVKLELTNMPEGSYAAKLLNVNGQLISQQALKYQGGTSNVTVKFNTPVAQGINIIEIIQPDGTGTFFKAKL